ncbi:glycosyl transferase group 1 [mine drainage metagenome]|uniref:Glycosyl transferase group 1 n=2 Tax=mine drainage metagenome TaxID=410659 RepID=T1AJB6_9ZZZZ
MLLRFGTPGGVETNVREVARGLVALGESVRVYAGDLASEQPWTHRTDRPKAIDGIPVDWFPVRRRLLPGLTMPMMLGLIRALDRDRPEILHAHSHRYGHLLEAAAVARRHSIPFVVSTHYHPADRREPMIKRGLLRGQDFLFGAAVYRRAQAIVVETELERHRVAEFAPRDRIHVIPPGVDSAAWAHAGDGPGPADLPDAYIVYAGRIASNKGLPGLVEAVARLPPEHRLPLVLVGAEWGEGDRIRSTARRWGIEDRIVVLGHRPDPAEYRSIVGHARLLVLPSEWEAFGLVLLEAMAARVPVVASAVGGTPEVVEAGAAGRLVPYGDTDALARAIVECLGDGPEIRRQVARGRARAVELDWSRAVERHRSLYRSLLERGG